MPSVPIEQIARTNRNLCYYQRHFGEDIGAEGLILDLGAGDSPMATQIRESETHLGRVVRLDLDYARRGPRDTIDVVAATAEALPFPDNTFDKIISSNMLLYFDEKSAAQIAAESIRVTKPGGRVIFDVGHINRHMIAALPPEAVIWKACGWIIKLKMLGVTKPLEYETWPIERRKELCQAIGNVVGSPPWALALCRTRLWTSIVGAARDASDSKR